MTHQYTALSLYSGAGGLDWGFLDAGFRLLGAVDHDRHAVDTYNANLGGGARSEDVVSFAARPHPQVDVVIGGPPCQGFSVAGRMDIGDRRSQQVLTFVRCIEALSPRAFVMENVKALATSPRWGPIRGQLTKRVTRLGYTAEIFVLNAADYGVPQARERMFLVGVQGAQPIEPPATTRDRPVTAGEALRSVPRFGTAGNDARCAARVVPAKRPVLRPSPFRGSLVFNGSGRPLDLSCPAKTLPASMGGNATPIVDQDELEHGANPWVSTYHAHLLHGGAPAERVSERMRRITVQEAAALQSFPPSWAFAGPRGAQYRQIGNAVPPLLAAAVAASVRQILSALDVGPRAKVFVPAAA